MAASMIRITRVGFRKAVQMKSINLLRGAPAVALSSKSGVGKKSQKSNKAKSTSTTYFHIEKLIQHKSVPEFPKKATVMPVVTDAIAQRSVNVPDTSAAKTSREPAPVSKNSAPVPESIINTAAKTETAPVPKTSAPEAAVPDVEPPRAELTPDDGPLIKAPDQQVKAEQLTTEGTTEVAADVTPEVPHTESGPVDDLLSEAVEVVVNVAAEVVAEVVAETLPVQAVVEVVESIAEAVAEAVADEVSMDERVDVTSTITDAAVPPTEVVEAPENGLDPVQRLFVEAIREFTSRHRSTGGLVDAGPEYHKNLVEETAKLQRLYGGGDITSFPEFTFPESELE